MIISRAELVALAAVVLLGWTAAAVAQIPPSSGPRPTTSSVPGANAPIRGSGGRVEVGSLGAPDGPPVGLLDSSNGGLGAAIWQDSPRGLIENLLTRLPVATTVPSLRALSRKLLLTVADAPVGAADHAFVTVRVQKLLEAGLLDDAADLAMKADLPDDPEFARVRADAVLLAGRTADVCGPATALRMKLGEPFWVELRAYCYAVAGDSDMLELTRQVMRAQGIVDQPFDALLDDVLSHKNNAPADIANPTSLHLFLLHTLGLPIDPGFSAQLGLPASVLAMRSDANSPVARLHAAEAAAPAGAATPSDLAAIVDAQSFAPEQIANAQSAAVTLPFLEGQGLLRQALAQETGPDARPALVFEALTLGAQAGQLVLAAQLQANSAALIRPDSSMRGMVPLTAAALMLARQPDAAALWLDALNLNAPADRAFASMFAVAIALDSLRPERQSAAQDAVGWLAANADSPQSMTAQYAALTLGIYRGLGLAVPPPPQVSPNQSPASAPTVPLAGRRPAPSVLNRIAAGLHDPGRKGEALLAMLDFIGTVGLGDIAPDVTGDFVGALRKMGLDADARALAIDAMMLYHPKMPPPSSTAS